MDLPWPDTPDGLDDQQRRLASASPPPWRPGPPPRVVAGCFVCSPRGVSGAGAAGDPLWAAAAVLAGDRLLEGRVVEGEAGAPYEAGRLLLREGPVLRVLMRSLHAIPEVLLVNATGRDHPRATGMAVHLGALLGIPSFGVTHRPLVSSGAGPGEERGACAVVRRVGQEVAMWVRVRPGVRPLVVHPGWRVDLETAVAVTLDLTRSERTPSVLREARRLARTARADALARATS